MTHGTQSPSRVGWGLLTFVLVVAVLHYGQAVLVPVALAVLIAFLLAPAVNWLQRRGCNRTIAVILTSIVTILIAAGLLYVVVQQFLGLVEDLPLYRDNLLEKIRAARGASGTDLEKGAELVKDLSEELQKAAPGVAGSPDIAKVQIVEPPPNAIQIFRGFFGPLVAPATTTAVVVVFVIFMLQQREDLRDRFVRLLGLRDMHSTLQALDDGAERVSSFLRMQLLINTIQGSVVALGLYLIGVPEAALWGALTVVLRFIPYLGPLMAALGPIALSIAFFDNWTYPLMTIALIATLEVISNNLLEPKLYGSSVGVSSLALLVATVFWAWMWGTVGLFLAIPLTVCVALLGKYIPQLEFLSVLLSDQPVLAPAERFYQRLLANDPEEAEELIEEAGESQTSLEVSDTMVLPALRFIEQDHDRGVIDEAKRRAAIDHIGEFVEDLCSAAAKVPDAAVVADRTARKMQFKVLCLPAADRADEVASHLFARLVEMEGMDAEAVSITVLKAEMLNLVDQAKPNAICISATPPAAIIHARYLCKRLRGRFGDVPIIVALWDAQGDLQKASARMMSAGANKVVTTATAAMGEVMHLLQPVIQGVEPVLELPAGLTRGD
jgi:predicted PurR-regulated permease PerM